MSQTKEDMLIFWGGTNDVTWNNLARGIKKIHNYMTESRHTNIMCVNVSVRYDLSELSFIKEEPRTFNRKLDRISSKYKHTNVLNVVLSRECFTRHGLHLRKFGKDFITGCTAKRIRTYQWQTGTGDSKKLEWHESPVAIPGEKLDEVKSILQTQPAKRLRSQSIVRSNDFLVT